MRCEAELRGLLTDLELVIADRAPMVPAVVWGMQQMLRHVLELPASSLSDGETEQLRVEAIQAMRRRATEIRERRATRERANRQ